MIFVDSHIHSTFSGDGFSTVEELAIQAVKLGLKTITITDHLDINYPAMPHPITGKLRLFPPLSIAEYKAEIVRVKEKFSSQLEILVGLEVGLQPQTKVHEQNQKFIEELAPDFVIGSTHVVLGVELSQQGLFSMGDMQKCYQYYLEDVLKNITNFDNFDSVGHLDFVERYYPDEYITDSSRGKLLRYEEHSPLIDEILNYIISKGKSIEINTGGIRYGLGEVLHPSVKILNRYKELGGNSLTIASDAHRAIDIASDFDVVEKTMRQIGFNNYVVYRNRTPVTVEL